MATVSIPHRERFVRLLHRELDLAEFFDAADRILAGLVPFDASCWFSLDPATLLPTSHFTREIGSDHLFLDLAANEFLQDDLNKFADLARASFPAGTLSEATAGDPSRSVRHSTVLAPHGFGEGDELRAVFLEDGTAWGCVAIHRRRGAFDHEDAGRVVEVSGYIAEGIRRAILTTALTAANASNAPGLIILRDDESVESMTPAARRWLGEMLDSTGETAAVPLIVASVADNARRADAGQTEAGSVRVPRRAGGWLLLHASLLDDDPGGRVGVVIHPAREPEIADLIVQTYGLSPREREVTGLVLRGLSTREIAQDLHVSAYTVQDHFKAIFAKVGVRSRPELVAQVFFQHYAPRLEAGVAVRPDGWFVDTSKTLASSS